MGYLRRLGVIALVLLGSLAAAQEAAEEKPLLDLRPQWTAGETYRRSQEYTLIVRGNLTRRGQRKRVFLKTVEVKDYTDRVLAARDGAPIFVRRTYNKHTQDSVMKVDHEPAPAPRTKPSLHGRTVTLIDRGGRIEASDPRAALELIRGEFDKALAKDEVRVGESWKKTVDGTRKYDLDCKVLKLQKYKDHPAAKIRVKLSSKSKLDGGGLDLSYRGYVYFATDIKKPLKIQFSGAAVLTRPEGKLTGTVKVVNKLVPLAGRVRPEDPPPPDDDSGTRNPEPAPGASSEQVLLKARWDPGEKSVVRITIVQATKLEVDGLDTLRGTAQTDVVYREEVLEVEGGRPHALRRTFTTHTRRMVVRMGGRVTDGRPEPTVLHGNTYVFLRTSKGLEPSKAPPKTRRLSLFGPVMGADWESVLPGRVVRVGESWETDFRLLNPIVRGVALGTMRLTLKSVRRGIAVIGVETRKLINRKKDEPLSGDFVWANSGTLQFSVALGKVVRADIAPPKTDFDGLGGRTTVVTTRSMR